MSETKTSPDAPPVYQPGQGYGPGPSQPYAPQQHPQPQPYPAPPQQQYPAQQYPAPPPQQYPQQQQYIVQQPGYNPNNASGVVVVQQVQPTVIIGSVGSVPMQTTCPNCRNTIVTAVEHEIGLYCWLIVGILFILGCWPCCLIPFCVDGCKDATHSCPSCRTVIGRYKRM